MSANRSEHLRLVDSTSDEETFGTNGLSDEQCTSELSTELPTVLTKNCLKGPSNNQRHHHQETFQVFEGLSEDGQMERTTVETSLNVYYRGVGRNRKVSTREFTMVTTVRTKCECDTTHEHVVEKVYRCRETRTRISILKDKVTRRKELCSVEPSTGNTDYLAHALQDYKPYQGQNHTRLLVFPVGVTPSLN